MEPILSPYIRRAWYNILMPSEVIGPRVIFDYELVLIKEGHADIVIEDKHYAASPGDMFIFRPRQPHCIYTAPDEQLIQPHIHFDLMAYPDREEVPISYQPLDKLPPEQHAFFREDILDQFISPFPSYIRPRNELYIEQLLFNIIHAVENPQPFNNVHLQQAFLALWEQVLLDIFYTSRYDSRQDISAEMFKQYIDHHASLPLTLDELSQATHFSKSYISKVFGEAYGISPMRYHASVQVQMAKQMILFTNMSLSEISELSGFASLQDFSRVFKKMDGVAPSSYRRNKKGIPEPVHKT